MRDIYFIQLLWLLLAVVVIVTSCYTFCVVVMLTSIWWIIPIAICIAGIMVVIPLCVVGYCCRRLNKGNSSSVSPDESDDTGKEVTLQRERVACDVVVGEEPKSVKIIGAELTTNPLDLLDRNAGS